jgi:hypothetical protein
MPYKFKKFRPFLKSLGQWPKNWPNLKPCTVREITPIKINKNVNLKSNEEQKVYYFNNLPAVCKMVPFLARTTKRAKNKPFWHYNKLSLKIIWYIGVVVKNTFIVKFNENNIYFFSINLFKIKGNNSYKNK